MARVLLFCSRPASLAPDEAETWLRGAVEKLSAVAPAQALAVAALHDGDADGAVEWDWLVEVDLPDHDDQDARRGLSELLLDLRLLGMQPSVVAVGRPIGTPAR